MFVNLKRTFKKSYEILEILLEVFFEILRDFSILPEFRNLTETLKNLTGILNNLTGFSYRNFSNLLDFAKLT